MLFWPKKWIFGTFLNTPILIICHGGHFLFSKLFFNVARYTLSAISRTNFFTPIDMHFFGFYFVLLLKTFFWKKTINISVVDNVPGNDAFLLLFWASLVWPFLAVFRDKNKNFGVPNVGKNAKKHVFSHTNQFSILVNLPGAPKENLCI